jgi:hypothetical protein
MQLTIVVDGEPQVITVADDMLQHAEGFFAKMDADMDGGWRMGREWVQRPDDTQRCQVAANKLLTALDTRNEKFALLLGAYMLWKMPGLHSVDIDNTGDMAATQFSVQMVAETLPSHALPSAPAPRQVQSALDAVEQAGEDVGAVYQSGRGYRFALYDHETARWVESDLVKTREEATDLRMRAYEARLQALMNVIDS